MGHSAFLKVGANKGLWEMVPPAHLQQSSSDYMSFPKKIVEFLVSVAFFKFNKEESQYNLW